MTEGMLGVAAAFGIILGGALVVGAWGAIFLLLCLVMSKGLAAAVTFGVLAVVIVCSLALSC